MVTIFYLLSCLFIVAASKSSDNSTFLTSVSDPTFDVQDTQLSNIQDDQSTTEGRKLIDETYSVTQINEKDLNSHKLKSNPRKKRDPSGLMSFFKSVFVKPTNVSVDTTNTLEDKAINTLEDETSNTLKDETSNTLEDKIKKISEDIPLSNIRTRVTDNTDEANTNIIDVEKDERKEDTSILLKLNETLLKVAKALSILAKPNNFKIAFDIPFRRMKRDVDILNDVTALKLNNMSKNVTKNTDVSGNVTKLEEANERETDFVDVTRSKSVNATEFEDNQVDETRSLRVDTVTYRKNNDNVTNTSNNVTNTSNNVRNTSNNVTNTSNNVTRRNARGTDNQTDEIVKTALEHIQQHILNIKSHKIASEESFKMGYIVSSLETLEHTLKKIMIRMTDGDDEWAQKISVKAEISKKVVSDLMEYLRMHTNTDNEKWQ